MSSANKTSPKTLKSAPTAVPSAKAAKQPASTPQHQGGSGALRGVLFGVLAMGLVGVVLWQQGLLAVPALQPATETLAPEATGAQEPKLTASQTLLEPAMPIAEQPAELVEELSAEPAAAPAAETPTQAQMAQEKLSALTQQILGINTAVEGMSSAFVDRLQTLEKTLQALSASTQKTPLQASLHALTPAASLLALESAYFSGKNMTAALTSLGAASPAIQADVTQLTAGNAISAAQLLALAAQAESAATTQPAEPAEAAPWWKNFFGRFVTVRQLPAVSNSETILLIYQQKWQELAEKTPHEPLRNALNQRHAQETAWANISQAIQAEQNQ